jgi:hypothetical protein
MWGRNIAYDHRKLVCFLRDVSLVSAEQYAALRAPARVATFPGDLTNRELEYSGVYEDGWVGDAAYWRLAPASAEEGFVVVRGVVPMINDQAFQTTARLLVDGRPVAEKVLRPGEFELRSAVPVGTGADGRTVRRVEVQFGSTQPLPAPDNRPVGAKLDSAGFERAATAPVAAKF